MIQELQQKHDMSSKVHQSLNRKKHYPNILCYDDDEDDDDDDDDINCARERALTA